MRGATQRVRDRPRSCRISIHAPHARSDAIEDITINAKIISIHAPHARSDRNILTTVYIKTSFQSTLLMRGATSSMILPI